MRTLNGALRLGVKHRTEAKRRAVHRRRLALMASRLEFEKYLVPQTMETPDEIAIDPVPGDFVAAILKKLESLGIRRIRMGDGGRA